MWCYNCDFEATTSLVTDIGFVVFVSYFAFLEELHDTRHLDDEMLLVYERPMLEVEVKEWSFKWQRRRWFRRMRWHWLSLECLLWLLSWQREYSINRCLQQTIKTKGGWWWCRLTKTDAPADNPGNQSVSLPMLMESWVAFKNNRSIRVILFFLHVILPSSSGHLSRGKNTVVTIKEDLLLLSRWLWCCWRFPGILLLCQMMMS